MKNNPNNFFYPKKLYYIRTSSHQQAVNKEKPKKCLLDKAVNKGKKKSLLDKEKLSEHSLFLFSSWKTIIGVIKAHSATFRG